MRSRVGMPLCPVPPPLCPCVSVFLFMLRCCAACGRRGGHWCCGVCFDFKSLPPLEDTEGRSFFSSAHVMPQRAHSHLCQACGWAREGRDLESSMCTCTWAPHACLPASGSRRRSLKHPASVELRPVVIEHAPLLFCPLLLALSPHWRPHRQRSSV